MKTLRVIAFAVMTLGIATVPGIAADAATEDAKQQYRAYLQQLKNLNQQYKQITGQIAEVVKEEGLPTWEASPAEGQISQMVNAAYGDSRVRQTDQELKVYLELPGLLRNTIKVNLENGQTLRVTAQKRVADEAVNVDQKVNLPVPALEKGSKAKYQDGILEITLPKGIPQQAGIPVN
jgi:HSP20 family molecular chaperone IbpA